MCAITIMLCLHFCLRSQIMCMALLTWFLLLKEEKRCLFCWAAVNLPWAHQSPLAAGVQSKMAYTHPHGDILTAPPVVSAGKTSMPNVMFQSLCQVWSVWTLHWALPYFLTLSLHCKLCWRAVPAVTTWRSKARPAWIQTNGPHLRIQLICWQRVKSVSWSSKGEYANSLI